MSFDQTDAPHSRAGNGTLGTMSIAARPTAPPGLRDSLARRPTDAIVQRALLIIGAILLVAGLVWPWLAKLPLGRLPGDIVIERPGLRVYLPVTTALLASVLVSLLLWLLRR